MSNESIYLVWNPCGENPTKRHGSLESAREEARRLCQFNQGAEFYVLRAIESIEYRTDPFIRKTYCGKRKEGLDE